MKNFPRKLLIFILLLPAFFLNLQLIKHYGNQVICNSGIAWGINLGDTFVKIFELVLIFVLIYFWATSKSIFKEISWGLILVGGVMNYSDRIINSCVRDYFVISNIWPVFNLADVFVTIGLIMVLLSLNGKYD